MSGLIPSFLNGSRCVILIDGREIAYAQNLSISDDMSLTPVGGIGAYNYQANEPTGYLIRGSMSLTNYSDLVLNANKTALNAVNGNGGQLSFKGGNPVKAAQSNSIQSSKGRDGNSFLDINSFSPAALILSASVDIVIYERVATGVNANGGGYATQVGGTGSPIYTISGVRLGSYSFNFSVGSLVTENVSFIGTSFIDHRAEKLAGQTAKVEV